MVKVNKMTTDAEIIDTYPVIKQLRPHLEEGNFLARIRNLQHECGYSLIAVIENEQVKAVAGYRITTSLAWGKYLYVDDLITDEQSRSKGYAALLFDYLEKEAKENQCEQFHLDSGVHRHEAHRFYLNRKMHITCHHFQRTL